MIIAVDGPAASGKGTLAKRLAAHFDLAHLDTGMLYRATGLGVLRAHGDPEDEAAALRAARDVLTIALDDPDLRAEGTGAAASKVAAIPSVRTALLDLQRAFAASPPNGKTGAVLDGRDIGSVICPNADHKFYVNASLETRAGRRLRELRDRGADAIYARVLADLTERDARDRDRSTAPMVAPADALVLDTTDMDADTVMRAALAYIDARAR